MSIYSKFIEVKGQVQVISKTSYDTLEINLDVYAGSIRPIFMEKLYLINNDVSQKVLDIDKHIEICGYEEEVTAEDHKSLVIKYAELELLVYEHLNKYRKYNTIS